MELLDNERLVNQLVGLERKTARGGKDSFDHGPSIRDHDDVANAVAGAVIAVVEDANRPRWGVVPDDPSEEPWGRRLMNARRLDLFPGTGRFGMG